MKKTAFLGIALIIAFQFSFSAAWAAQAKMKKKAKRKPKVTVGVEKTFGAGPMLGTMIGVNGKYWYPQKPYGAQGFVGYAFSEGKDKDKGGSEDALALGGDGLYHFKDIADIDVPWEDGKLHLYGGLVLKSSFPTKPQVVIRIPIGANAIYAGQDWDTFAELVPGVKVAPETGGNFDFVVGMRYYF